MYQRDKEILHELSEDQLIYLIQKFNYSMALIGEVCVSASKEHIDDKKAIEKIRGYIYDLPSYYDAKELKACIDMEQGKMSKEECRNILLN